LLVYWRTEITRNAVKDIRAATETLP